MLSLLRKAYQRLMAWKKQRYIRGLVKSGLTLGANVEIIDTFFFDPSHCFLISIGDNCTLAPNVRLIAHDASSKKLLGYTKIGKIRIGENCFIGDSVIVLPGVTIGANCVIGAGSVVTRDVPPNTVAAGNPARQICSTQQYTNKIERLRGSKPVFGYEYYIECLTEEKRAEVLAAVADGTGFIV